MGIYWIINKNYGIFALHKDCIEDIVKMSFDFETQIVCLKPS